MRVIANAAQATQRKHHIESTDRRDDRTRYDFQPSRCAGRPAQRAEHAAGQQDKEDGDRSVRQGRRSGNAHALQDAAALPKEVGENDRFAVSRRQGMHQSQRNRDRHAKGKALGRVEQRRDIAAQHALQLALDGKDEVEQVLHEAN